MLLECGDRTFDLTHRTVVLGVVIGAVDHGRWIDAGVDGLVVGSSSEAAALCDRVDVPVGVLVSPPPPQPATVEFPSGATVPAFGPLDERRAARIGRLQAEIEAGGRVLVVDDPSTVGADRRVAEVMARLLTARATAGGVV